MFKKTFFLKTLGTSLFIFLIFSFASNAFAKREIIYLYQGWTPEERRAFYETAQGSFLVPLSWFLALETAQPDQHNPNYTLFSSPENIRKFGYLVKGKYDGEIPYVPLGFAVEPVENGEAWLGYTCAACHTNEMRYKNKTFRIDGAPTLADLIRFISELRAAVDATLNDDEKFIRFSKRIFGSYNPVQSDELYEALADYAEKRADFAVRNQTDVVYGHGRLDAFGILTNEIFVDQLQVPENVMPPSGPVSYPFLWGTPQHDFVQWIGSASNPLSRNIGEVLGTFGSADLVNLQTVGHSTARIPELIALENLVDTLKAPKWPEKYFGKINKRRAARGKILYEQVRGDEPSCVSCHALKDSTGQYPLTPAEENFFGAQFVVTHMSPLAEIGTDPTMALNFATRVLKTGNLAPILPPPFTGASELPGPVFTSIISGLATQVGLSRLDPPLSEAETAAAIGYRIKADGSSYRPKNILAYRARPLDGIWATAPYLHNGSVQNLYELLKPSHKRKKSFYVGSNQFDPKRVGFKSRNSGDYFLFDTRKPSNSNAGHDYGVYLSTQEKWDLIEFLKTL